MKRVRYVRLTDKLTQSQKGDGFCYKKLQQLARTSEINLRSTKLGFIKRVDKGRNYHRERSERLSFRALAFRSSSEQGLTLETFQIFHGDNSSFISSFGKTKFSCFTLPTTQLHSFYRNKRFVYLQSTQSDQLFLPTVMHPYAAFILYRTKILQPVTCDRCLLFIL